MTTPFPRLTVYFIAEPPEFQVLACFLAASLRTQFGDEVALVGYCPAHKFAMIDPAVHRIMGQIGCDLRPFASEGRFDPAYPQGNKILATLEPRDTEYSCFMDSDVLCIRPNAALNLIHPGRVALTPAASMNWAGQEIWGPVYAAAGMEMPAERMMLMKQKRGKPGMPYFSSGLFAFPESHRDAAGRSFGQVWYDLACQIDACEAIPHRRPYLDQISLPLAIRKAGLDWHLLPEEQHFILGGKARGKPLPEGREIFTVHYRQWPILKEVGLQWAARNMLKRLTGLRSVPLETPPEAPGPALAEAME